MGIAIWRAAIVNTGLLFYLLRAQGFYEPRVGWLRFAMRLLMANAVLATWLWVEGGALEMWLSHETLWRALHLAWLLLSSILLYLTTLWLTGVRLHHLLMPDVSLHQTLERAVS